MKDVTRNRTWATRTKPLASYLYETFSADDYNRFCRQYISNWPQAAGWAIKDFTKPGLDLLALPHQAAKPSLDALWHRIDEAGDTRVIVEMSMPDNVVKDFGAPAKLTTDVHVHSEAPVVDIVFQYSPLAAPGNRSLLDFNNRQPSKTNGVHFNLHNNIWGTNFPMWYEEDGRFGFSLALAQKAHEPDA